MKKAFFYLAASSVLAGFFIVSPAGASAQASTQYNPEKIFYVSQKNAVSAVASLDANWQKVDIVAPQMYAVNLNMDLVGKLGPKLKQVVAEHNLKVMPLVVNASFSRTTIHKLLTTPNAQDDVITGLIYIAKKDGYIGWQYDLENIDYKDRDLYTAFVQKTYTQFQKNNLIFSVAAVARFVDYENTVAFKDWSGVYDYAAISKSTDFISLMAYDDPKSVGPVASVDFVSKCLDYMKDKVPPEKLSLGVPLYYWKWDTDTDEKVGAGFFSNVLAIMSKYAYSMGFDSSLGVSDLSYSFENKNYKIWFEDQHSLQEKIDLAKAYNLRGFSAWQLGGEDPGIWSILVPSANPVVVK